MPMGTPRASTRAQSEKTELGRAFVQSRRHTLAVGPDHGGMFVHEVRRADITEFHRHHDRKARADEGAHSSISRSAVFVPFAVRTMLSTGHRHLGHGLIDGDAHADSVRGRRRRHDGERKDSNHGDDTRDHKLEDRYLTPKCPLSVKKITPASLRVVWRKEYCPADHGSERRRIVATHLQASRLDDEINEVAVLMDDLRSFYMAANDFTSPRPVARMTDGGGSLMSRLSHSEIHMVHRIGWLRAAVLGANDGLVSTASLVVGVAAAGSQRPEILVAGLAGLVAGAMSMAAGEYVSVSSQTDAEKADIARETRELKDTPEAELDELTGIYVARGLDQGLARQVAVQLTAKDALGAHARDELGISETVTAHPIQAALVSAATFAVGAVIPLIIAALSPPAQITLTVAVTTLVALSVLGGLGASAGGAGIVTGAVRVTFWGALAMAATAGVGMLFGVTAG